MEIQLYTTHMAVLFLLCLTIAVSQVEAGGYSASLEAARLVAEGKITVETNVSAPINNSRLGIPYRTGYHFQPKGYWINGPVYYKGYYHLFYQYNPFAAVPGTIEWDHAVSKDMIHWQYLGATLRRDQWYDANGVWSGSITFLDDGSPVILYTGNSVDNKQYQARADPVDPSDPLLRNWIKLDIKVAFKIPDVKQGPTPPELLAESGPCWSVCRWITL